MPIGLIRRARVYDRQRASFFILTLWNATTNKNKKNWESPKWTIFKFKLSNSVQRWPKSGRQTTTKNNKKESVKLKGVDSSKTKWKKMNIQKGLVACTGSEAKCVTVNDKLRRSWSNPKISTIRVVWKDHSSSRIPFWKLTFKEKNILRWPKQWKSEQKSMEFAKRKIKVKKNIVVYFVTEIKNYNWWLLRNLRQLWLALAVQFSIEDKVILVNLKVWQCTTAGTKTDLIRDLKKSKTNERVVKTKIIKKSNLFS